MLLLRVLPALQRGLIVLTIGALIVSSGCSTLPGTTTTDSTEFASNIQLQHWQLRGKIGILNNNEASSAYLNWQQCGERFDIRLSGPLGQGAARLLGDQQRVILESPKRPPISADNPEQLLRQQLGWDLPISQLTYWIRGIPAPDSPFQILTDSKGFQQLGWHINILRSAQVGEYSLPTKVIAKHPQLKITLILKHWKLQPNCD